MTTTRKISIIKATAILIIMMGAGRWDSVTSPLAALAQDKLATDGITAQSSATDGELDAMLNAGAPASKNGNRNKASSQPQREETPTASGSSSADCTAANSATDTNASDSETRIPDNDTAAAPSIRLNQKQTLDGDYDEPPQTANIQAAELNNAGVEALLKNDYEQAVTALEQSIKLDPNYRKAKENLRAATYNFAMKIYDAHDYAKALPVLQRAKTLTLQLGQKPEQDLLAVLDYCQRHASSSK